MIELKQILTDIRRCAKDMKKEIKAQKLSEDSLTGLLPCPFCGNTPTCVIKRNGENMKGMQSTKNGEIAIFTCTDGIEFATQPKDRRKSSCGGDGLNVVKVPYTSLEAFIKKLSDIECEYLTKKYVELREGKA